MTAPAASLGGWREVREEARRRIAERIWAPGETIPHETALAEEFGVARPTVNRAMRALADEGLIERRRKAGTRVAETPKRHARAVIPLIREEIETTGAGYGYALIGVRHGRAPEEVNARFGDFGEPKLIHVAALHLADGAPYVLEERWINLDAVPDAARADFAAISGNEWLVRNAPFTGAAYTLGAEPAGRAEAAALAVREGAPILVVERLTRSGDAVVTIARLAYAPGYRMRLSN